MTVSIATGLPRPLWRGRLHTWAFAAGVPATIALLIVADGRRETITSLVYGLAMMAVFGISASYHRLARSDSAQRVMQRLDHSAIYLLIAGTYTPVCLLALPPQWGRPTLAVVWIAAAVGIGCKLFGSSKVVRWSNGAYPAIGWASMVLLPVLLQHLSGLEFMLLLVGGAIYTIGAIIFMRRRPDPIPPVFGYHEVWHLCTVLAGLAHYLLVMSVTAA